jgi:hypothetical protein
MQCTQKQLKSALTRPLEDISDFWRWEEDSHDTVDLKKCYIDLAGDLKAGLLLSQIISWFLLDDKDFASQSRPFFSIFGRLFPP